jgi:hypothetical protein
VDLKGKDEVEARAIRVQSSGRDVDGDGRVRLEEFRPQRRA